MRSVNFSDEIIIADMGSTDRTKDIAKKFNCKVMKLKKEKFADPARAAVYSKAISEYILVIDSDEIVTPLLKKYILKVLKGGENFVYNIPRVNFMLGKSLVNIKKGKNAFDRQIRLSPNNSLEYNGKVHNQPVVKSKFIIKNLDIEEGYIAHFSHIGLEDIITRGNTYSSLEALNYKNKKYAYLKQLIYVFRDLYNYIKYNSYKDGFVGIIKLLTNINYRFMIIGKIYQYRKVTDEEIVNIYMKEITKLK